MLLPLLLHFETQRFFKKKKKNKRLQAVYPSFLFLLTRDYFYRVKYAEETRRHDKKRKKRERILRVAQLHNTFRLCVTIFTFCHVLSGVFDPHKYTNADMCRIHAITYECLMEDEESQVRGFVHFADGAGVSFPHLTLFTPKEAVRIVKNGEVWIVIFLSSWNNYWHNYYTW